MRRVCVQVFEKLEKKFFPLKNSSHTFWESSELVLVRIERIKLFQRGKTSREFFDLISTDVDHSKLRQRPYVRGQLTKTIIMQVYFQ